MSSLPVPVSPVMSTLMSVPATFCSLRNTSIIEGQAPMISPKRLSLSSAASFSLSARSADREHRVLQDERRLPGEDAEQIELAAIEQVLDLVVADVERADDLSRLEERRTHHARELEGLSPLSLLPKVAAPVSASLTIAARFVSITWRTMLVADRARSVLDQLLLRCCARRELPGAPTLALAWIDQEHSPRAPLPSAR